MRRSNEETVNEVLKLQNENYKLNEIAEKMESNPTTIRRAMNRSGYKTKNGIFIKEDDKSITNVINDSNNTDNKIDDKDNTSVIQLNTVLKIDLPEADIKRTTIRVNEKIWNNFNNLADKYKEYDKHSLLSMALKEFIERYQ